MLPPKTLAAFPVHLWENMKDPDNCMPCKNFDLCGLLHGHYPMKQLVNKHSQSVGANKSNNPSLPLPAYLRRQLWFLVQFTNYHVSFRQDTQGDQPDG